MPYKVKRTEICTMKFRLACYVHNIVMVKTWTLVVSIMWQASLYFRVDDNSLYYDYLHLLFMFATQYRRSIHYNTMH